MNGSDNELTNFADGCRGHRTITVTFLDVGRVQAQPESQAQYFKLPEVIDRE